MATIDLTNTEAVLVGRALGTVLCLNDIGCYAAEGDEDGQHKALHRLQLMHAGTADFLLKSKMSVEAVEYLGRRILGQVQS